MGLLKPDVEKMEAEKDVKRLLRTLKYDEDDDVRNKAAEALRNISRGENKEITSESEEMKKAEGTFKQPQLMALTAGIGLVIIQKALYTQTPLNIPFSISLYFFTSLIFGYLWPNFYKGLGVLVVLPSFILVWGVLLLEIFNVQTEEGIINGIGFTLSYLFLSVLFFLVTNFGAYLGSQNGLSGK